MIDKNGIEIKTGSVVEITGAYFKNDNGLYFVTASPGDPSWCGSDYSLTKISKTGKISTAKYRIGFWPIMVCVSDRMKRAEANRWNAEHAAIEVKQIQNTGEISSYFQGKADAINKEVHQQAWRFGEDSPTVKTNRAIAAHYEAVATAVRGEVEAV